MAPEDRAGDRDRASSGLEGVSGAWPAAPCRGAVILYIHERDRETEIESEEGRR
jgi:hypothetical protein